MQNRKKVQIPEAFVGLDLGHAETAVSTIISKDPTNIATESLELHSQQSWPTAMTNSDRGVDLGIRVRTTARESDCSLILAFKARPDEQPKAGELLVEYACELWKQLKQYPAIDGTHYIMLGCPTGWKPCSVDEYRRIMHSRFGGESLEIARESRAAVYQALQNWNLANKDSFFHNTLVIDVGSSTTDISAVLGPADDPIDMGADLGCGMIDQIFVDMLPEWQPDPKVAELLGRRSPDDKKLLNLLLLTARDVKEEYCSGLWRNDSNGEWLPESQELLAAIEIWKKVKFPFDGTAAYVDFGLTAERMEKILSKPVPQYDGRSFREQAYHVLETAKIMLDAKHYTVKSIVLTGGGSKMPLFQRAVRETFPTIPLAPAGNPSLFIAHGLALCARQTVLTNALRHEIDQLLDEKLDGILKEQYGPYKWELADDFASELVNLVISKELDYWRDGIDPTLDSCEADIISGVKSFFSGGKGTVLWRSRTGKLMENVKIKFMDVDEVKTAVKKCGYDVIKIKDRIRENKNIPTPANIPSGVSDANACLPDLTSVMTVIVGVLAAVLVAVLAIVGPVGWAIIVIVASMGARRVLRETKLPNVIRRVMLSDDRLSSIRSDIRSKLKSEFHSGFGDDFEALRLELRKQIRDEIESVVEAEMKLIR